MHPNHRHLAHLGICAAAAVFVDSLSILFFGSHGDSGALHTLEPAQIHVSPSAAQSHAEPDLTGARAEASDPI
jgi:hypothetical protein